MATVLALFAALVVFAATLMAYLAVAGEDVTIKARLNAIGQAKSGDFDDPLSLPFTVRIVKPAVFRLSAFLSSLLPANLRTSIDRRLLRAGNPHGLKAGAFIAWPTIFATILSALMSLSLSLQQLPLSRIAFSVAAVATSVYLLAYLWLERTANDRVKQIERSLPDVIDLLVVTVEAGLGFDQALARVTTRMQGPLSDEIVRALQEMKLGKPRDEALKDMAHRVGAPDVMRFFSVIIQATQMGLSTGHTLRVQSDTMRRIRRQKVEESAMKAPILMLFPTLLCIFPVLFIVVAGPGILKLLKVFK